MQHLSVYTPAPILQGMGKCHLGNMDGRISQPDTKLQVPETSTVSGERKNSSLITGPCSWIWLAGPLFILLFQIINYSLRSLLFSLFPTHLPPPNHHPPTPKYIHTHLNPMGDTGTQAATHPHVYQLVQIDLEGGVLEIWVDWGQ